MLILYLWSGRYVATRRISIPRGYPKPGLVQESNTVTSASTQEHSPGSRIKRVQRVPYSFRFTGCLIYIFFFFLFQVPPPETHNGPLRGFKIAYRLAGVAASTFIIKKIDNSAATQGNIDGLVQWTAYEIKVLAYNDAGDGKYSNPITSTTAEGGK